MNIEYKTVGKHTVMMVDGELNLYNNNLFKKAILSKIDDPECKSLVIDLQKVKHMDSTAIGALVVGKKKMSSHNGNFGLINIPDYLASIIGLVQLDSFFTVYKSMSDLVE